MKQDVTFCDASSFGSDYWCAATLGRSYDWFRDHRTDLQREGFPAKDPIIGLTNKADVRSWIARRRKFSDAVTVRGNTTPLTINTTTQKSGENLGKL